MDPMVACPQQDRKRPVLFHIYNAVWLGGRRTSQEQQTSFGKWAVNRSHADTHRTFLGKQMQVLRGILCLNRNR